MEDNMKIKNKNLEWNVLIYEHNKGKFTNYNIFSFRFIELVNEKLNKDKLHSIDELKELILNWSRRKYWCKSEYEILVGDLSCRASEKIDAFRQIEMNIDRITEYVNKELDLF
jgi:hypothetical protein